MDVLPVLTPIVILAEADESDKTKYFKLDGEILK